MFLGSGSSRLWLQIFPLLSHFSGNWVGSSRPSKLLRGVFPPIIDDYLHLIIHMHILFSLIRRLMASTIHTGTMTSVVAVITLILFLTDKEGNCELIWQHLTLFEDDLSLVIVIVVSSGFAYCLARIYTLTMLYNLNNRSSLRQESANTNDAHRGNTMNITTEIRACLPGILLLPTETWSSFVSQMCIIQLLFMAVQRWDRTFWSLLSLLMPIGIY